MGAFPETGLARARKLRDEAKPKLAEGHDPVLERKIAKVTAKLNAGIIFALIACEYIDSKMVGDQKAPATISKARWFLEHTGTSGCVWRSGGVIIWML